MFCIFLKFHLFPISVVTVNGDLSESHQNTGNISKGTCEISKQTSLPGL